MGRKGGISTLAILACLGLSALAPAQPMAIDPVERLRQALRASGSEPAERYHILKVRIAALRSPGELRRAYNLTDWRERGGDAALAAVDRASRSEVGDRFIQATRELIQRGDPAQAAAAVEQVTELAREARAHNQPTSLPSQFMPDLMRLILDGAPPVRAAAAAALGQVDPLPEVALPALAKVLTAKDPPARQAAAGALAGLLQRAQLPIAGNNGAGQRQAVRREVAAAVTSVVRLLGTGLGDWHPEVRRRCAAAAGEAAGALGRLTNEPVILADGTPANDITDLRGLAFALGELSPMLARVLRDGDTEVRLAALKALEETAAARAGWLKAGANDDPLLTGLKAAVPALSEAVTDPEVRVRRSAIDVLEWLGPAAAGAAPALTRALTDPDRFVRWSAVRTLNALGPQAARPAAVNLARLLEDPDLDIRLAAAAALERLDAQEPLPQTHMTAASGSAPQPAPEARAALANLARSLKSSEVELRLGALRALRGLGPDARPAVPALREVLRDPNVRVRVAAAEVLGELGPLARDAVEDLRVAVADRSAEVRRAAGEALLSILRGQ